MMEFNGAGPGAMMLRTPMPMQFRSGGVMRPSRVRVRSGAGTRSVAPLRIDKGGAAIIGDDGAGIIRLKDGEPLVFDGPEWDEFDGAEWDGFDAADAFDGADVFEIDSEPREIEEIEPVPAETIREMGESAVRAGQWALKKLADEGLLA
jgi:hypothetical protein